MDNELPSFSKLSSIAESAANQQWNVERSTYVKGSVLPARLRSFVAMSSAEAIALNPPLIVETSTKKLEEVVSSQGEIKAHYSKEVNPSPLGNDKRGEPIETVLPKKNLPFHHAPKVVTDILTKKVPSVLKVHTPVITFIYDYGMDKYKKRPRSRLLPEAASSIQGIKNCYGSLDYDKSSNSDGSVAHQNTLNRAPPRAVRRSSSKNNYGFNTSDENDVIEEQEEAPLPEMDVYIQSNGSNKLGHVRLVAGEAVSQSSNGTHLQPPNHVGDTPWLWSEHTRLHSRQQHRYHEHSATNTERTRLAERGLCFIVSKHERLMMSKSEFKKLQDLKIKKDLNDLFIKNSVVKHLSFNLSEPLGMELEYDEELNHISVFEVFQGGQGRRLGVFPTSVIVSVKGEHRLIALENNPHHHYHKHHHDHRYDHTHTANTGGGASSPLGSLKKIHFKGVGAFNEDVGNHLNEKNRHEQHLKHQHELHVQQEHQKNVATEFEVHTLTHFQNAVNIVKEVYSNVEITFLVPIEEIKREKEQELAELLRKEKEREEKEVELNSFLVEGDDEVHYFDSLRGSTQRKGGSNSGGNSSHSSEREEEEEDKDGNTKGGGVKQQLSVAKELEKFRKREENEKKGSSEAVGLVPSEKEHNDKLDREDSNRIKPGHNTNPQINDNHQDNNQQKRDGGKNGAVKDSSIKSTWGFATGGGVELEEKEEFRHKNKSTNLKVEDDSKNISPPKNNMLSPLMNSANQEDLGGGNSPEPREKTRNELGSTDEIPVPKMLSERVPSTNFEAILVAEELEEEKLNNDEDALLATRKKFEVRPMFENQSPDVLLSNTDVETKRSGGDERVDGLISLPDDLTSISSEGDHSLQSKKSLPSALKKNKSQRSDQNGEGGSSVVANNLKRESSMRRSSVLSTTSSYKRRDSEFRKVVNAIRHTLRSDLPLEMGKSKHDDYPVNLFIVNHSHFHLEIGWINYHGSVVVRRVLPPNVSHFEVSYATHPWILTTMAPPAVTAAFFEEDNPEPSESDNSMIIRLGNDASHSGSRGAYSMIWQPQINSLNLSQQPPQTKLALPNDHKDSQYSLKDSNSRVRNAKMNLIKQIRSLRMDPTGIGISPTITITVMASDE